MGILRSPFFLLIAEAISPYSDVLAVFEDLFAVNLLAGDINGSICLQV
jgi:hypothetical protein